VFQARPQQINQFDNNQGPGLDPGQLNKTTPGRPDHHWGGMV